jgi:hypothetical protein
MLVDLLSEQAGIELPSYTGRGLANLAPTYCRLFGDGVGDLLPPLVDHVLPQALLDDVQTVVVLLVDGLGYALLRRGLSDGDMPALASVLERGGHLGALTSVFPSATMSALATVHTGVSPAQHGVMGWTMFLEEFGAAAEMARWGPIDRPGVSYQDADLGGHDPLTFLGVPTVYQRLAAHGVRSYIVNPAEYKGTALSRMLFAGSEEVGYRAASGMAVNLWRVLDARQPGERTLIYGYYPTLDTTAHLFGPHSEEHRAELSTVDFLIGRWQARAPRDGRTLVLLTADHGHVATPPEQTIFVDLDREVASHLRTLPTGERRMLYLHVREGAEQETRALVEQRWGHAASVVAASEAFGEGLFGPGLATEAARQRAGDLLVIARNGSQLTYAPRPKRPAKAFYGNHGALDSDEMLVPLLAWRL